MRLTGADADRLATALSEAMNVSELRRFMRARLDRGLDTITLADDYASVTFDVVEAAERGDWIPELVAEARNARPRNGVFQELGQALGAGALVSSATPEGLQEVDAAGLERVIDKTNALIDIVEFRGRLSAIEPTVCRVEVPTGDGMTYGTGFLVGPNLVMTNYHVVESPIASMGGARGSAGVLGTDVRFRFDYKRLRDGRVLDAGSVARPATDWLYDSSPPTAGESGEHADAAEPRTDQLDYAVVRLAEPVGERAIGPKPAPGDPARGWIPLVRPDRQLATGDPLFIVQHPDTQPMKVALDTDAIIGLNANRTRVRYRTNTQPGSSGAPCFDQHWNLVALHHFGDPNFWPWHRDPYNQGVPIGAIVDLLESRGQLAEVSKMAPAPP